MENTVPSDTLSHPKPNTLEKLAYLRKLRAALPGMTDIPDGLIADIDAAIAACEAEIRH